MTLIFGNIVLGLLVAAILFLLWQRGRLRREPKEKTDGTKPQTKEGWKKESIQALWIGGLIILLVCILWWEYVQIAFSEYFWTFLALAVAIAILCIAGDPKRWIRRGRFFAYVITAALLICLIFWPAAKTTFPGLQKIENVIFPPTPPSKDQQKTKQSSARTPTSGFAPRLDWSRATTYTAIEIPAGTRIATPARYRSGDMVRFAQLGPISDFCWIGTQHTERFTQREVIWRAGKGSGGPWPISLQGGQRPVRVVISVLPRSSS
ncbi:hypothetical protein KJ853_00470 [Patescibacteria group bacterium]|nr:hypothetical protein [Patescibacteria group bacterium]